MIPVTLELDEDMFEALQECAQETGITVEEAAIEVLEIGLFEVEEEEEGEGKEVDSDY